VRRIGPGFPSPPASMPLPPPPPTGHGRVPRPAGARTVVIAALAVATALGACRGDDPPVPTELVAATSLSVTARVGEVVTTAPAVSLTDQRARALANVLVTWRVVSGGGAVDVDTVRTDASGRAAVGRWTLGGSVGDQTLSATVAGVPPVVFRATAAAGPPAAILRRVPEEQLATVGALVPAAPAVQVVDAFGNPVPEASVNFLVTAGSGTLVDAAGAPLPGTVTRVTDANGVAAVAGWRLGTTTAETYRVVAGITGLTVGALFRGVATSDVPVRLEAASVRSQAGVPGADVPSRPAVRAFDRFGNPASGATVVFTPSGGGTVIGNVRQTAAADGIARVGRWILGTESVQQLVATSPAFAADTFTFTATAVASVFDIDVRFLNGTPSTRNAQAVSRAVERWRQVIAGQLPPVTVVAAANACGPGVPALNDVITNVRIYVNLDSIDGPGTVLGRAGPCFIRTSSGLPVVGFVELDTADLAALDANGTLDDVMTHEVGHVIGLQAFNWDRRGLLIGRGGADPIFQGAVGRDAFADIGGGTYSGIPVPVENTGGQGTRDSHWRATVLGRELMVGFARVGGMPLSRLTVGALADLGYVVRLDNAESFTVPPFGSAAFGEMVMPGATAPVAYGDDSWPGPIYEVDPAGRRRLVRDGDWRTTRRR
jgi:hypothetical protein